MTYDVETTTERAGAWDRTGREVTRIRLHDPEPHPLNEAWQYDPDTGVVVDERGQQVGVDFDGRVHDEHGRELDAYGDPIAEADGTPIAPDASTHPPNTGRPMRRATERARHAGTSGTALKRRFPALRQLPDKRKA